MRGAGAQDSGFPARRQLTSDGGRCNQSAWIAEIACFQAWRNAYKIDRHDAFIGSVVFLSSLSDEHFVISGVFFDATQVCV